MPFQLYPKTKSTLPGALFVTIIVKNVKLKRQNAPAVIQAQIEFQFLPARVKIITSTSKISKTVYSATSNAKRVNPMKQNAPLAQITNTDP
jgi:hypothetical protein